MTCKNEQPKSVVNPKLELVFQVDTEGLSRQEEDKLLKALAEMAAQETCIVINQAVTVIYNADKWQVVET
jgi:ABC-type transport system involved in Fe-S cluster assembly fused permease/ATPase subunit